MESNRLILLPPSLEHQPAMLEAIRESQAELSEFLPWVPYALTEAESIKNTKQAISNYENVTGELRFTILKKDTSQFVGAIGIIIRDKKVPYFELGYWLKSAYAGLGYMTEAVKVIENYAFNELNANRLEITASEKNIKSCAVAKRCGYNFEGKLINHRRLPSGQMGNTVVFAKTTLKEKPVQ